jgi:alpha-L-fucosidase
MSIKNLDSNVIERLYNIIAHQYEIIVGDADGVDSTIQSLLKDKHTKNVTVYCAGDAPRNNLGSWTVEKVQTIEKPGTRAFFTAKDLKMAESCDYGLMVWDTKSTGTLSNTMELLKRKKYSLVYINKVKEFLKIKKAEDIEKLLSYMSDSAFAKADEKLRLKKQLETLRNNQPNLF